MYRADFNAYRDFFLMYVAVGIFLVLINTNSNFVMAFSFQIATLTYSTNLCGGSSFSSIPYIPT